VTQNVLTSLAYTPAIIDANDDMALGALEALQQMGIPTGKILVLGIDGLPEALVKTRSSRKNQRRRDGWFRSIPRHPSKDGSRFVDVVSAREETDRGKVVNFRGDRKIQFTKGGPLRGDEIGRLKLSEATSSKSELEHPLLSFVLSVLAQIEGLTKRRCLRSSHSSQYASEANAEAWNCAALILTAYSKTTRS